MNKNIVIPVILCGGSGTRLWPLSRESFPKQFISIGSEKRKSLLQNTQLRIKDLENLGPPIFVCNKEHRFIIAEQIREINIENFSILLEPVGRNTAPAITVAALKALEIENDPILLILASDHEIINNGVFYWGFKIRNKLCEKRKLVSFGILPTFPETGYGYIKARQPLSNMNFKGEIIEEFLEKPNFEKATEFIKNKQFSWNSGIFMFKAKTLLDEIEKFSPEILFNCKKSFKR